jgi:hypothetical protein
VQPEAADAQLDRAAETGAEGGKGHQREVAECGVPEGMDRILTSAATERNRILTSAATEEGKGGGIIGGYRFRVRRRGGG